MIEGINWAEFAPTIFSMLAAGLFAGFAAGVFGIGGGFVVVPALYAIFTLLGGDPEVTTHVAIGTSLSTIIVTSIRSVQAHAKRGAVDFDVLRTWAPFIVAGVLVGLLLAKSVDGETLTIIFSVGVFIMGLYMMFGRAGALKISDTMPTGWLRAALATFVGSFASLMGIGGGTFAILVMTLFGKSIHQAIATAAGFGLIIAIPGAIGFAIIGWGVEGLPFGSIGYINLIGFAAITAMTAITAPLGAYVAHRLDAAVLKRVFATYLLLTTGVMFYNSFVERTGSPNLIAAGECADGADAMCGGALIAAVAAAETTLADYYYAGMSGAPPEEDLLRYERAAAAAGRGEANR
ncbi:MAG: sulfite exporter TauE/SafE family protein [Amphiplicatus sp.]